MKQTVNPWILWLILNIVFSVSFFTGVVYLEQTRRCNLGMIIFNVCDKYGWDVYNEKDKPY